VDFTGRKMEKENNNTGGGKRIIPKKREKQATRAEKGSTNMRMKQLGRRIASSGHHGSPPLAKKSTLNLRRGWEKGQAGEQNQRLWSATTACRCVSERPHVERLNHPIIWYHSTIRRGRRIDGERRLCSHLTVARELGELPDLLKNLC